MLAELSRWSCAKGSEAVIPPSAKYSDPLTYSASSDARNAATPAISSGLPRRGTLFSLRKPSSTSGVIQASRAGVWIRPGTIPLQRIPCLPKVVAMVLIYQFTMALERSEEHTSELQSLMRISYAVFCLKKKRTHNTKTHQHTIQHYKRTEL